ncbi:MAG: hypothetical protein QG656_686, partial [Candidatus Hydrogenedentes bacterium]|nr:hypothetical protein [Candidatus Hydrogenedentota bacterium]
LEAETALVGLSPDKAGHALATAWGIPPGIAEAIRYHHHPAEATKAEDYVAAVAIANDMSRVQDPDAADNARFFTDCHESMARLGLTEKAVLELLPVYFELLERVLIQP